MLEKLVCRSVKDGYILSCTLEINRFYDGAEADTRKSQASFQII